MDLLPTGRCFDDALDYIEAEVRADVSRALDTELILCHGIVLAPEGNPFAGTPYAHAWVIDHGAIISAALLDGERVYYAMDPVTFIKIHRVQAFTLYSVEDAWRENDRTGMYGPWKEEYLALCGQQIYGRVHVTG